MATDNTPDPALPPLSPTTQERIARALARHAAGCGFPAVPVDGDGASARMHGLEDLVDRSRRLNLHMLRYPEIQHPDQPDRPPTFPSPGELLTSPTSARVDQPGNATIPPDLGDLPRASRTTLSTLSTNWFAVAHLLRARPLCNPREFVDAVVDADLAERDKTSAVAAALTAPAGAPATPILNATITLAADDAKKTLRLARWLAIFNEQQEMTVIRPSPDNETIRIKYDWVGLYARISIEAEFSDAAAIDVIREAADNNVAPIELLRRLDDLARPTSPA